MNEDEIEKLWGQVLVALDSGEEERVISMSRALSDAGDWRGSNALGYVFEVRARRRSLELGKQDKDNFIAAAHWYTRALSQGGGYAPHSGLANYYYYGLGGEYDFSRAYEHLKYCVEYAASSQAEHAAVQSIAQNQIKLAELLLLGLGTAKDLLTARELFSAAAEVGYPAAFLGLSRIERAEGNLFRSVLYFLRAYRTAIRLILKDRNHPMLAGVGGRHRTFRRDWHAFTGEPRRYKS